MSVSTQLLFLLTNDGSAWTLACARVGVRALSATRQAATMSQASVATDVHEALDIGNDFTTQITLDLVIGLELFAQRVDVVGSEVITVLGPINARRIKDFESCSPADPVNICQCNIEPFISRQIYTN